MTVLTCIHRTNDMAGDIRVMNQGHGQVWTVTRHRGNIQSHQTTTYNQYVFVFHLNVSAVCRFE